MIGSSSLLAAVLTVMSLLPLSLLSLLCLWCKRKSKIIHNENQIYSPQTFERGGSMFAVTRSKTVTRPNQITSTTVEPCHESSAATFDGQADYENIIIAQTGSFEDAYVAPLPISLYENEETEKRINDADEVPGVYANIALPPIKDDEDDYENAEFLDEVLKEEEESEPDYVNENGE